MEKREQVSIYNYKKQEEARAENNLMKDIQIKSQFLEKVRKKQEEAKNSYAECVKSRLQKY